MSFAFSLVFFGSGCQTATETLNSNVSANSIQPSRTPDAPIKPEQTIPIDVPKLAGKSPAELDDFFGAPQESATLENGGGYRLYKIAGQTKGLAVRFYGGRAKSFNLISDKPYATSKEAVRQVFNIDVGNSVPGKDAKEPLTEMFRGTFGGVRFAKLSAKKQADGKGFIFVLAEVSE